VVPQVLIEYRNNFEWSLGRSSHPGSFVYAVRTVVDEVYGDGRPGASNLMGKTWFED
jgi:hypothetical protein